MEEARIVFEHVYRGAGPPQATDVPVPQRPVPAAPSDAGDGPADVQAARQAAAREATRAAGDPRALPAPPVPAAPADPLRRLAEGVAEAAAPAESAPAPPASGDLRSNGTNALGAVAAQLLGRLGLGHLGQLGPAAARFATLAGGFAATTGAGAATAGAVGAAGAGGTAAAATGAVAGGTAAAGGAAAAAGAGGAGAAGAGLAAAGGPVGLAVGATVTLASMQVKALNNISAFAASRTDMIAAYSPEIGRAMAENDVAATYRNLRAARELGPLLADHERARGAADRSWQDLQDEFAKFGTPVATEWEKTKAAVYNIAAKAGGLVNNLVPDEVVTTGAFGPLGRLQLLALQRASDLANVFWGDDKKEPPDVFGWWAEWPHLGDVPHSAVAVKVRAMIAKGVLAGGSEGRPASFTWTGSPAEAAVFE